MRSGRSDRPYKAPVSLCQSAAGADGSRHCGSQTREASLGRAKDSRAPFTPPAACGQSSRNVRKLDLYESIDCLEITNSSADSSSRAEVTHRYSALKSPRNLGVTPIHIQYRFTPSFHADPFSGYYGV